MKPSKINLAKIDELGRVRIERKKLDKRDKELTTEVKPLMDDGEVIETGEFRAELVVRNNRVMDYDKVRAIIGQKKFFELATISQEDLKKVLGADQIDECTVDFKPVRTLNVDPQ